MGDFLFLAVPNIEGMRLGWYIQIIGIVVFFGVCLFFVMYFWSIYRRKQTLTHQMHDFDEKTRDLGKQLLHQKIKKTLGKKKLILFIEYLEKFITNTSYANVGELLIAQGFTPQEIESCEQVLYADKELSQQIEIKIDEMLRDK